MSIPRLQCAGRRVPCMARRRILHYDLVLCGAIALVVSHLFAVDNHRHPRYRQHMLAQNFSLPK